jgi:putative glutamine amidotransferase
MTDERPVVALSGYRETASWGAWTLEAGLVPWAYVRAIRSAGGEPVVIPPGGSADLVSRVDALVMTGGIDIDSRHYGEEPHPENDPSQPDRDRSELGLLDRALASGIPVLGVCRGMQLMSVAHGGRLHQHLPDVANGKLHLEQRGVFGRHDVTVVGGSLLADIYDATRLSVPTYHHQAVADPGTLVPIAFSDDHIIEAVYDPTQPFVLGVQWHPEVADDHQLFGRLVHEASAASRAREALLDA